MHKVAQRERVRSLTAGVSGVLPAAYTLAPCVAVFDGTGRCVASGHAAWPVGVSFVEFFDGAGEGEPGKSSHGNKCELHVCKKVMEMIVKDVQLDRLDE